MGPPKWLRLIGAVLRGAVGRFADKRALVLKAFGTLKYGLREGIAVVGLGRIGVAEPTIHLDM